MVIYCQIDFKEVASKRIMDSSYGQTGMTTLFHIASIKEIKTLHKWPNQKVAIFRLRSRDL